MNLSEYQKQAMATAVFPPQHHVVYTALGLGNEAGEVQGKVKKWLRGDGVSFDDIAAELGDVLWYLAALAAGLGFDLDAIARANLAKLASRQARGVLNGSGDNR